MEKFPIFISYIDKFTCCW